MAMGQMACVHNLCAGLSIYPEYQHMRVYKQEAVSKTYESSVPAKVSVCGGGGVILIGALRFTREEEEVRVHIFSAPVTSSYHMPSFCARKFKRWFPNWRRLVSCCKYEPQRVEAAQQKAKAAPVYLLE